MDDEELLQQAAGIPTIYVDGFGAFRKINGSIRCVGYVIGSGAQINLIVSLSGAQATNAEIRRVLEEPPAKPPNSIDWLRMAH